MKQNQGIAAGYRSPSQNEISIKRDTDAVHNCSDDTEEGCAAYIPGGFHPVYIGDIFNGRYEVKNKIGYGIYSTVWLVRDLKNQNGPEQAFRALKILSAECYGAGNDTFEREILTHLRKGDRSQLGYAYVCHLIDDFQHQGPNGSHICLVFELMGETLRSFGAWFLESRVPTSVMRRFTIQLLLAVDYAHETDIIHTDIKPDNIFVKFRDHSKIEQEYLSEVPVPLQDRKEVAYSPIPSRSLRDFYFNEHDSQHVDEFDIALGDWGVSSWKTKHLTENIQPVALRSPEVLIQAPWDASTDWWNLGAVIHEIYRAIRMFSGAVPPDGHYELKEHIAEMINLFGPFPKELLEKGNQDIVRSLFDNDGTLQNPESLIRADITSDEFTPGLDQETRDEYVSFLQALMKINPGERLEVMDLLRHPWLGAVQ